MFCLDGLKREKRVSRWLLQRSTKVYSITHLGSNDLKQEYLDMKQDLTPSPLPSPNVASSSSSNTTTSSEPKPKAKTVPKWLQKGLFNKK